MTVIDEATGHVRRSAAGRLYHGETAIDFYGRRWWGLGVSALLLLVSVGSLLVSGIERSLDFKGGVVWEIESPDITEARVRELLNENDLDGGTAKVQVLTAQDGSRTVEVQVAPQPDEVRTKMQAVFANEIGATPEDINSESVSSTWGKTITNKAIFALAVFLVLVAMFIAWRLEWRMAISAIVAMLHDVLLSVGFYSVFGFEVTPATVVAFLTILGFSLYDTIVVFDKVRENQTRYIANRIPYSDVLNVSMNQVLMRSLNTSLAAVLPVLSLLVLGSGILGAVTLREFALALLVGLLTGSYSSVFIASPLMAVLKEREPRYKSLRGRHATGADLERLVLGAAPLARGTKSAATKPAEGSEAKVPVASSASDVLMHAPRPRKKKRR